MSWRRKVAAGALVCAAALATSGCIRLEVTAHVDQNGTVTKVDMVYGLDKNAGSALNGLVTPTPGATDSIPTDLNSFKQSLLSEDTDGSLAKACTFSETNSEFVANCSMTKDQFSKVDSQSGGPSGLPTFTRSGQTIQISYTPTADSQLSGMSAEAVAAMGVKMTMTLAMPGPVTEVKGTGASVSATDPNALVIDMVKATPGQKITAVSTIPGTSSAVMTISIVAGLCVLLLIVVVAFVMIARRHKGGSGPGEPVSPESGAPEGPDTDEIPTDEAPATTESAADTQEGAPVA